MADEEQKKQQKTAKTAGPKASDPPWARKDAPEDDDDDEKDAEFASTKVGDSARAPDTGAKMDRAARAALAKPSSAEDDEDDEDEDEDDGVDDEEDQDDDVDDEDEDDEEDEDEDDEPPPPKKRAAAPAARASQRRPHAPLVKRPAADSTDDWIPDWLPWAVLIVLLAAGLLGGLGVFGSKAGGASSTSSDSASPATTTETAAAPSPTRAAPSGETIGAQHLLVQYTGSMRAAPGVKRTKEEAKKRAEEALAKAKKGENFGTLVVEYSDEPGAGQRQGRLGRFTREAMVKPFSDAAFRLKPGEISGVVETDFGFHVIKRTE